MVAELAFPGLHLLHLRQGSARPSRTTASPKMTLSVASPRSNHHGYALRVDNIASSARKKLGINRPRRPGSWTHCKPLSQ